jgi:hypothetical protein
MITRIEDGIAEAAHLGLPDEMNARHALQAAQGFQILRAALGLQLAFQLEDRMEVLLDGALAAADDDEDVRDARVHGLFHDILNDRLVHEGQHLLRHSLGDGQEAGAETGGGNDSFTNFERHGRRG